MAGVRHLVLTRSAYGPAWDLEANRRRLAMTEGVTIRSLASQTSRAFEWLVLLHRRDELLEERRAAFAQLDARFLYIDVDDVAEQVAWQGYAAGWADAIGPRDRAVAMTRLDDDDAFAPWALRRVEEYAARAQGRVALMLPLGVRAWAGRYTPVRHDSNAMQTLVTPRGDAMTVYDYPHRLVRKTVPVRTIEDRQLAWLWSRHPDTISGWRLAERPLTAEIRRQFDVDWSLFGDVEPAPRRALAGGYVFR